ncbi:hypothetical protein BGZ73_001667 [Actinomortierella ambigua]|nr:hypothetical protein BGZ73_001667 [Actinomortierella ambigua]
MPSLTIETFVGGGAFGQVFHAQWEGRKVAIKKFLLDKNDVRRAASIQREIEIVQSLSDRHIIQFYGTTFHDGQLVLIMDYAEGGSLQRAIESRRTTDWSIKTDIVQGIVRGLNYIHHKQVLHRDLKSMNVLLTRRMEVKLCDFGLATAKTHSASKSTSTTKGTLRWMAPEVLAETPKFSTKSDMYALGMVMWELAAQCTTPFKKHINNTVVMGLVQKGMREVLPNDTPPEFRQWVERCWDQEPAKRPEASEMVTEDNESENSGGNTGHDTSLSATQDSVMQFPAPSTNRGNMKQGGAASQSSDDISALLARANLNDIEAQLALAAMYEMGNGVDKDMTEAFRWYLRASELGSPEAQFKTGEWYASGTGTAKDDQSAAHWMKQAAENSHPVAQRSLASMYQRGLGVDQNYEQAIAWYRKSAESGDAMAQFSLGWMYEHGQGTEQDYGQAAPFYIKSADQGHASAQHHLAWMYKNGRGVEKNYSQALSLFRKSADQGDPVVQFNLGLMYQNGEIVERDYSKALRWFCMSAEQGYTDAQNTAAYMYQNGLGAEQDYEKALLWIRKSADQGDPVGQNNMGRIYQHGLGVEQDYDQALHWYHKAQLQGSPDAQCNLGSMYKNGHGVERDYDQAFSWYLKSAKQGNPEAQNNLGWMYKNGHAVPKDKQRAIQWYRKAADQGHPQALKQLQFMNVLEGLRDFSITFNLLPASSLGQ